jgi:hypothetical protein
MFVRPYVAKYIPPLLLFPRRVEIGVSSVSSCFVFFVGLGVFDVFGTTAEDSSLDADAGVGSDDFRFVVLIDSCGAS